TVSASRGAGLKAVQYLTREGPFAPRHLQQPDGAERAVGYLERTSDRTQARDDLRYQETMHLPALAHGNAATSFAASATYERAGGRWATSIQASLPRALSLPDQIALSRAFMQATFPGRPTLLVIHAPVARDGEANPHFHALLSERLDDGIVRGPG